MWPKIKVLFEQALEIPPEEREAFLQSIGEENESLVSEVRALLEADEKAASFLEEPVSADFLPLVESVIDEYSGKMIGPYELVRQIGSGGMGTVYLARRADGQFAKTFALKLVRSGLGMQDILSRFRYERQILATLNHPNISQFHDGGVTDSGRPYFVMEYVDGLPITQFCNERKLTINERLVLFIEICNAVWYAHKNLVVHRDIKPSNILVNKEGQVKLLDFGIAKLLNEEGDLMTRTGMRVMTPEYASPEQIRGERGTTAMDIYSLGVLLYELLSGHRPYQLKKLSAGEIEQIICEREPIRPSTATTIVEKFPSADGVDTITPDDVGKARSIPPERLKRRLTGDLDNIVLMALRKDSQRRYASVEQFSEDIKRHLRKLPVIARPDEIIYRATQFTRRHTVGVLASILILLFLAGGILATSWQARIASEERDRAKLEKIKAEQINVFLQDMLASVDPHNDGRDVTVAEVLEKAVQNVDTDLNVQPLIEASIRRTIGVTYQGLARYDEAEVHLLKALKLYREHLPPDHPDIAQSIKDYGLLKHWQGDLGLADEYYRNSILLFRNTGQSSTSLSNALNDYGTLLLDQGNYSSARDHFREALLINRVNSETNPILIASNITNLALSLHYLADVDAADSLYREAMAIQLSQVGPDHIEVAYTLNNLAWVLLDKQDINGADSLFHASLAIRRKQLGNAHPSVALALLNLANLIELPRKNYKKAESFLLEGLAICNESFADEHPYTANILYALGQVRVLQNRTRESISLFQQALEMRKKLFDDDHPAVATSALAFGEALMRNKQLHEAEAQIKSALMTFEKINHADTLDARQVLINLYYFWGKPEMAQQYLDRN